VQGRNLRVETRWAGGDPERIRNAAAELVALAPDVLLVNVSAGMDAMQRATRTVPVVFVVVPDPVGAGYADSLADPAAMRRVLANSSTGLERNGWSCSRSFRRNSTAQASFEIPR
jgi:hypothetical protein